MLTVESGRSLRVCAGTLAALFGAVLLWGGTANAGEPTSGTSQSFSVVVPEHEVPTTTTPTTSPTPPTTQDAGTSGSGSEAGGSNIGSGSSATSTAGSAGTLPRTGFDPGLVVLAVILILMGAVLRSLSGLLRDVQLDRASGSV